jgi:hypothetical protein
MPLKNNLKNNINNMIFMVFGNGNEPGWTGKTKAVAAGGKREVLYETKKIHRRHRPL